MVFSRRFGPLLWSSSLGAFNDNLFKNALVVLLLFGGTAEWGGALVALAGILFVAPYVFLGAWSGRMADTGERHLLVRRVKLLEVALMLLGLAGFWVNSVPLLMLTLLGLGVQATLFSPMKYSMLPDHLAPNELVRGNGILEAGTFTGILLGTVVGGGATAVGIPLVVVGMLAVLVAFVGWAVSLAVLPAPITGMSVPSVSGFMGETRRVVREAMVPPLRGAILGIGWFWTVGAVMLTAFPVVAAESLKAPASVVTLLLSVFTIGIAVGSLAAHRLTSGLADPRRCWLATLVMAVTCADFAFAAGGAPAGGYSGILAFLSDFRGWRMTFDLAVLAFAGGVLSVPLYALMQEAAPAGHRSSVIAANNILNAAMMVAGSAVFAVLHGLLGWSAASVLLLLAALNLPAALVMLGAWGIVPTPWLRETAKSAFRAYYRVVHYVRVDGVENIPKGACVFVPNHVSYGDGILLAAHLPNGVDPLFAVFEGTSKAWWARPFLALADIITVDWARPHGLRVMVRGLRSGRPLVLFPEGRLSRTGGLMKVYEGGAVAAAAAGVPLVPVRIEGMEGTMLSRTAYLFGRRRFPRVTIRILPPVSTETPEGLRPRDRRAVLGERLCAAMENAAAVSLADESGSNLWEALVLTRNRLGGKGAAVADADRTELSRTGQLRAATVLGRAFLPAGQTSLNGERLGVLLPNAKGAAVTFWGILAMGGVPAMLNFSAGPASVLSCLRSACVTRVISARSFVEKAKLGALVAAMEEAGVAFVWLEDIRASLGLKDRLRGLFADFSSLPGMARLPGDEAAILFTSGSEGNPKGVALSHRNVLANCAQMRALFDFTPADRVLNAMPVFHAFGLVGGLILPALAGCRTLLYPSPLHYRVVPELAYDDLSTVVFATDTFLAGWARFADPRDFTGVRLAFAGAERLRPETRRLYADKFGVRVLEGYGATECSPVISVNTPAANRPGSVGRLLPGVEAAFDPVPGLDAPEGAARFGRLRVRGPNIMAGYLLADTPGEIQPPFDGWHDTGDVVSEDAQGFLEIRGRAKRFAKIAGEMVSMAAAEDLAGSLRPEFPHAVASLPDPRKGERLVLVTASDLTASDLLAGARARGMAEIAVPREVVRVGAVPLLPTGKVDHPAVARMLATRSEALVPASALNEDFSL